ncbi:sigma-70 family RNA polymerase sigma factor [Streptomyces sp. NPDC006540]|uniref:sigma-70 family RNA polymerase sigma factor n=1 Tax=Streptomyces sp. NPDC006540 TaxID=3155353 RepID=UPI0033A59AD7
MSEWKHAERVSFWAFYTDRIKIYLRYAYLQLGSDADAEEAVDRAFDAIMDAWQRMLEMEHLEKYAWTVLKRRIVDQSRRRKVRPEPMDITAFEAALKDAVADPYEGLTGAIQFYAAVRRLSERQRDAVILRYGLDCSTRQAAALMGIDPATVRSLLSQACNRLAQLIDVPTKPSGDGKARS